MWSYQPRAWQHFTLLNTRLFRDWWLTVWEVSTCIHCFMLYVSSESTTLNNVNCIIISLCIPMAFLPYCTCGLLWLAYPLCVNPLLVVESDGPSEVRGHLGHLKVLEELSGILQHYHLVQDERGRTEREGDVRRWEEGGKRGGERVVESIAVYTISHIIHERSKSRPFPYV